MHNKKLVAYCLSLYFFSNEYNVGHMKIDCLVWSELAKLDKIIRESKAREHIKEHTKQTKVAVKLVSSTNVITEVVYLRCNCP